MKRFSFKVVARGLATSLLLPTMALVSASCVMNAGDSDEVAAETQAFTRTVVTFHEDGTETVQMLMVTREQQLEDQRLRALRLEGEYEGLGTASDAISKDASCAGSSIWIFDQTGLTGNEICFTGAGIANLNNYCRTARCGDTWGQDVRSYWAGVDWGQFSIGSGFTCGSSQGTCGLFSAYQQVTTASSCEQFANYLGLQQLCIPA